MTRIQIVSLFLQVSAVWAIADIDHLDSAGIRRMYSVQGDTKGVLDTISAFQHRNKSMGKGDSLVLLKYHGMIYYHFPELNSKDYGELCFKKMIEMDTSQEIRSLHPSKAALALVESLKAEARRTAWHRDSLQKSASEPKAAKPFFLRPEGRKMLYIGAAAAVGVGTLSFILLNEDFSNDRYHTVPKQASE